MKKLGAAFVVVLLLGTVLLAGLGRHGFKLGPIAWSWSPELALLEDLASRFLTDLKFKDFEQAAKYHTVLEQAKVDIPVLIERLFQVKPEFLNIRDFQVVRVELDPDGKRARTIFKSNVEFLNTAEGDNPNKEKQVEGILYWHKRPAIEGVRRGDGTPAAGAPAGPGAGDGEVAIALPPGVDGEQWFMKLESSLHGLTERPADQR